MSQPIPSPRAPAVRGVIFDIGNVLIRLRPIEAAVKAVASRTLPGKPGLGREAAGWFPPQDPLLALRSDPVCDRFERGLATEKEFYEGLRRAFGIGLPDDAIRSAYDGILGEPMPGMADLIGELRGRRIRVVGLTDISPRHLSMIDRYPAVRALERVVASCATGFRKPEAGAYRAALEAAGTVPDETLFVDDQPGNVNGARSLGLQALVFSGAEAIREYLGVPGR